MEVTTQSDDGVAVIVIKGAVDADEADRLHEHFGRLLGDGQRNFVVDLSGVTVVDGTGLATLVNFFKRVRIGPGDVRLCAMPTWVTVIFAMTRLNKVFKTFSDQATAVGSYR